jgi:uridylate kinase
VVGGYKESIRIPKFTYNAAFRDTLPMSDALPLDLLKPVYHRVLLKLSGEAFGPPGKNGIGLAETLDIAQQLKRVVQMGAELAIVVGGGNLLRGAQFAGSMNPQHNPNKIKPATADSMGMLATVMNGLALQDTLEGLGIETRLMSAIPMDKVCEPYIRRRAIRHLEKKRVVILAGGTGNPHVTTDTAAALRGRELEASILLKATKVDGVYDSDPDKNAHAMRYDRLTFKKVLEDRLKVMDLGAFEHCQEARLPILVFDFKAPKAIERAIAGEKLGTLVTAD